MYSCTYSYTTVLYGKKRPDFCPDFWDLDLFR